jgi:hypothetical protein
MRPDAANPRSAPHDCIVDETEPSLELRAALMARQQRSEPDSVFRQRAAEKLETPVPGFPQTKTAVTCALTSSIRSKEALNFNSLSGAARED